ncbi:MAG: hypothetical protein EPO57_08810, partial [Chitinophagaceae bacterium]
MIHAQSEALSVRRSASGHAWITGSTSAPRARAPQHRHAVDEGALPPDHSRQGRRSRRRPRVRAASGRRRAGRRRAPRGRGRAPGVPGRSPAGCPGRARLDGVTVSAAAARRARSASGPVC